MTRETSERIVIAQLSTAMASKLALSRNRLKPTWYHMSRFDLLTRLRGEVDELTQALAQADFDDPASVADVEQECADVARYAAMIIDNARNHWGKR